MNTCKAILQAGLGALAIWNCNPALSAENHVENPVSPIRHNAAHQFNFDGAGASDLGVYREGEFRYFRLSPSNTRTYGFGASGDVPLPADYDGDGKTDFAVYRSGTQQFLWVNSSNAMTAAAHFGNPGDIPIAADFDGDGKTDLAIYRPSTSTYWYLQSSTGSLMRVQIGEPGDVPVVGDFDGDGKDEAAVFKPGSATFIFTKTSDGALERVQLGRPGDTPIAGDFDGDGIADLAVYRAGTSTFIYRRSSDKSVVSIQLGQHGDIPIVGDFDADGKTDVAVFRPGGDRAPLFLYRSSATQKTVTIPIDDGGGTPLGARYQPVQLAPVMTYSGRKNAPQLVYQKGVPHTDRNGRIQLSLDSASFFPRCAYETIPGTLASLKNAGFNCFKPWNALSLASVVPEAREAGMQLIKEMDIAPCNFVAKPGCNSDSNAAAQIVSFTSQIAAVANDPSILGWYIEDEPTSCINPPVNCSERFTNYQNFRAAIKSVDAVHPSFNLDISLPYVSAVTQWNEMNSTGDIAANDNYPFHKGTENTLENSVADYSRLVALNHEEKPVWITIQDFGLPASTGMSWTMPTASQLRAEVFAAIVHGATGIIYFALDSVASRGAHVIGISPSPLASYPGHNAGDVVATPGDISSSKALWNATVALNSELQRLQNVILSPTATLPYEVVVQGRTVTATPVRSILKVSSDGVYTLLVINIDNVPLTMQFTFSSRPFDLYSIDDAGSRYPMGSNGNSFSDSIQGFGIRIYEFK
jgi:hypothetical protein